MENQNQKRNILAILAVVFGAIALGLSWIPIINNLAFLFGLAGAILGIVSILVKKKIARTMAIVGTVLSVVSIFAVIGTQALYKKAVDTVVEKATGSATSSSDSSKWNGATKTFTGTDETVKIDSTEKITDASGKPAIKVNFTITNNKSTDENVQILYLDAVSANQKSGSTNNDLQIAFLGVDAAEDHLQDKLTPNGTIQGYYAYTLQDATNPVVLTFKNGLFSTKDAGSYEIAIQ